MVLGLSPGWGSRPDVSFIDFSPPTTIVKVQLYSISWVQLLTGITRFIAVIQLLSMVSPRGGGGAGGGVRDTLVFKYPNQTQPGTLTEKN